MAHSSRILLRSVIFISAMMFHASAHAEAKVGDRFGDWALDCQAVAAEKNVCALTQVITKNKRPLLKLRLRHDGEKKDLELVAWVPLGIQLPVGVTGAVAKDKAFPFTVQTCIKLACIATAKVDANLLKSMQSSEKLAITFFMLNTGKPVVVEGSLKGLAEGLKVISPK